MLGRLGCCASARAPGTAAASSRSATRGSASCRSVTRTDSGATSPERGCGWQASCGASSAPFRWTRSQSSSSAACRSDPRSCSSAAAYSRRRMRASATPSPMSSSAALRAALHARAGWSSMAEDRFARAASLIAAQQDARAEALASSVQAFVLPKGDERALDVGCGAGALALALAPRVQHVIGVDRVPELLAHARERAPANVDFVEGDATHLEFEDYSFDRGGTLRTLHHVGRPELVIAELTRVTRLGGRILVVDQLAPADPLQAPALDAFERVRDDSHARLLSESDLRQLFEANGLALLRERRDVEDRDLEHYLDLALCEGDRRAKATALSPNGSKQVTAVLGWFLLERR